jgi:hypothetical protein
VRKCKFYSDDEEISLLSAAISASSRKAHVTEVIFRVSFILIATEALTSAVSKWRFAPSDGTPSIGRCARLYTF